ncbi:MAG: PIN domain-containing protein [Candidatus Diapherotrites archaeon]
MSIFLDSGYLIALNDKRDKFHSKAFELGKKIDSEQFDEIFISEYVFDETTTFIAKKESPEKAILWGEKILDSKIELIYSNQEIFEKAWDLFKKRKNLSFTDCAIIESMKANGIKNLATFDKEFKQFKEIKIID